MNPVFRVADAGIPDLEAIHRRREDLGKELRERRVAAGLSQDEFAAKISYTRGFVSNAENGTRPTSRKFWRACDRALGTGTAFSDKLDHIFAGLEQKPAQVRPGPGLPLTSAIRGSDAARAEEAYLRLGWPVGAAPGGKLALVTGGVADAYEVPAVAGALAARWWLETNGREDLVRSLPGLPSPSTHLAVVDAGDRCYFLVRAGSSPWPEPRPAPETGSPTITWHAAGSRIPLPPASARWAFLPYRAILLPPPLAMLHLLGVAAAVSHAGSVLNLPGGAVVAPASPCGPDAG